MPAKDTPDTIRFRTAKAHERKILILLGLMDASSKDLSVPNRYLSGERTVKTKLRKSIGKAGKINICKSSDFEIHQVRYV